MTFDEETDAPDPLVAERFQLLDQLAVPPMPTDGVRALDATAMAAEHPSNRRPAFALAAAAAVLVVAALSALAFTQRDNGQELVALESNQVEAVQGPLVVEDDATEGATTSTVERESETTASDATNSAAPTTQSTDVGGSSTSGGLSDTSQTTAITTSTTLDSVTTTEPSTTATTATSTSTTTATTTSTTTTSTTTTATQGGDVTTISGLLTVVFTDCQSRLVLNDSGEVENVGPISCDGGSYIVVDGIRIQTSAGFVASDAYWDKHPSNFQPGQTVVVTAFVHSSGRLDLSCNQCSVRWG